MMITAAVVGIAVIGYGIHLFTANREKAQAVLASAIQAIDSPIIRPGVPHPDAKFKTEEERASRSEAMFDDVKKKCSGTDAAVVADVYPARLATGQGDTASARKTLEAFVHEHPKHLLVGASRYSLDQPNKPAGTRR